MNRPDPWSLMEPAAKLSGDDWRRRPCDKSTESERSIAISLKRIADNLDLIVEAKGITK